MQPERLRRLPRRLFVPGVVALCLAPWLQAASCQTVDDPQVPALVDAAPPAHVALWCSAPSAETRRLFVSDIVHLHASSKFRLWNYQDRFARAAGGAATCRMSRSTAAATAQRANAIDAFGARQWTIVTLGVF